MVSMVFWFALVGWTGGWVTGRAMKCQSHSQWIDSLVGTLGGIAAGYPVRGWEAMNWGFLWAEMVATAGAVLLTWGAHRLKHMAVDSRLHKHDAAH